MPRSDGTPVRPRSGLISTGEAAAILGTSRQHVVNLCEAGKLPCSLVGTHRRIRLDDVLRLQGGGRGGQPTKDRLRSLWLHQAVARRIVVDPESTLRLARTNLRRLRAAHTRGAAAHWLAEWDRLLEGPLDDLVEALTSRSERGYELRQNSPFAGVLTKHERDRVLQTFRHHAA